MNARGLYVPSEYSQLYASWGFEIIDDLRPGEVLAIPREFESRKEQAGQRVRGGVSRETRARAR